MGLIKSINSPPTLTPFSMADIENQARAIVLRARQKADQLLIEARRSADEVRRQAQAEGLAAGYDDGIIKGIEEGAKVGHDTAMNEYRGQFVQLLTALTTTAGEFDARRRELEADGLTEVIELAIAIAERVTKRLGVLDPQVVLENVAEALQRVVASADVRIALHPMQLHVLTDALPRLKLRWPDLKHIELVADESLAAGGCLVYTRHGVVDAALDGQLSRIARELVPAPREARAPVPTPPMTAQGLPTGESS